jgi:hypothetical protein
LHPAVRRFARECVATLARLAAYCALVGGLGFGAMELFAHVAVPTDQLEAKPEWTEFDRASPAFAVDLSDLLTAEPRYAVRRHVSGGGRRDLLLWRQPAGPFLAVELYRPGLEDVRFGDPFVDLTGAVETQDDPSRRQVPAFVLSKFGRFALAHRVSPDGGGSCLGFHRAFEKPDLHISGVYCGSDAVERGRDVIACALDRLDLVSTGGDARLARLFARAALRRAACAPAAASARHVDWLDAPGAPKLRR